MHLFLGIFWQSHTVCKIAAAERCSSSVHWHGASGAFDRNGRREVETRLLVHIQRLVAFPPICITLVLSMRFSRKQLGGWKSDLLISAARGHAIPRTATLPNGHPVGIRGGVPLPKSSSASSISAARCCDPSPRALPERGSSGIRVLLPSWRMPTEKLLPASGVRLQRLIIKLCEQSCLMRENL